jgi:FMN-dependent NADH-azoreductase
MKKILHIISSPRGDASFSIRLGNAIIEKLKAAHPGSTVKEYNVVNKHFPHLEESHITSFFTPPENRSAENIAALQHSDDAIKEVLDADIIVIGAPMYNYSIHSSLKAWLDHIIRSGVTFSYDEKGPKGLVNGKKVYIALSSGGIFSEGPQQTIDFIPAYLKTVLGFIGMKDVTVVRVEGTSLPATKDTALEKSVSSFAV